MKTSATKVSETMNAQGEVERKVEAIECRSSAGQGQEQRKVEVIKQPHPQNKSASTSGSLLAGAAASAVSTLETVKGVISGK